MVLQDEYTIELPPDLPPDEYSIRIGLYDASGTRLPISDGDKQLDDAAELGAFQDRLSRSGAPSGINRAAGERDFHQLDLR